MSIDDKLRVLDALSKGDWRIGQLIIEWNGNIYNGKREESQQGYSDEQTARALSRIVGKEKPIDCKWKWAGAYWYLRWACNYPADPRVFCIKISKLPFESELEIMCEYNNIRKTCTLSFMNEDPLNLESVRYSKNDESVFFQIREVVIALRQELQNPG